MLKKRGSSGTCSGDLTITVPGTEEVLEIAQSIRSQAGKAWNPVRDWVVRLRQDALLALRALPMKSGARLEMHYCRGQTKICRANDMRSVQKCNAINTKDTAIS